jgi:CDGSH-type Zn-finger protein
VAMQKGFVQERRSHETRSSQKGDFISTLLLKRTTRSRLLCIIRESALRACQVTKEPTSTRGNGPMSHPKTKARRSFKRRSLFGDRWRAAYRTGDREGREGGSEAWEQREAYETQDSYALCRCGRSKKPFCDGTHSRVGFDGTETANRAPCAEQAQLQDGPAEPALAAIVTTPQRTAAEDPPSGHALARSVANLSAGTRTLKRRGWSRVPIGTGRKHRAALVSPTGRYGEPGRYQ